MTVRMGCAIALMMILFSCVSVPDMRRTVHEGADALIVLDGGEMSDYPLAEPPYEHPADLPAALLESILGEIRVRQDIGLLMSLFTNRETEYPLFNPQTLPSLSAKLSHAFSEAREQERVHFYQVMPRSDRSRFVTSGSLFKKDGFLHLRVEHFRVPLEEGTSPTAVDRAPTAHPSVAREYDFTLLESPRLRQHRHKNIFGLTQTDPHFLIIDVQRESDVPTTEEKRPSPPPSVSTPQALEEKLRVLQGLREKDLITEEEYREKKKQILESF